MNVVVQKNAASAEESASASEEMNAQAGELKTVITDLVLFVQGTRPESDQASRYLAPAKAAPRQPKSQPLPAASIAREVRPDVVIPLDDNNFRGF